MGVKECLNGACSVHCDVARGRVVSAWVLPLPLRVIFEYLLGARERHALLWRYLSVLHLFALALLLGLPCRAVAFEIPIGDGKGEYIAGYTNLGYYESEMDAILGYCNIDYEFYPNGARDLLESDPDAYSGYTLFANAVVSGDEIANAAGSTPGDGSIWDGMRGYYFTQATGFQLVDLRQRCYDSASQAWDDFRESGGSGGSGGDEPVGGYGSADIRGQTLTFATNYIGDRTHKYVYGGTNYYLATTGLPTGGVVYPGSFTVTCNNSTNNTYNTYLTNIQNKKVVFVVPQQISGGASYLSYMWAYVYDDGYTVASKTTNGDTYPYRINGKLYYSYRWTLTRTGVNTYTITTSSLSLQSSSVSTGNHNIGDAVGLLEEGTSGGGDEPDEPTGGSPFPTGPTDQPTNESPTQPVVNNNTTYNVDLPDYTDNSVHNYGPTTTGDVDLQPILDAINALNGNLITFHNMVVEGFDYVGECLEDGFSALDTDLTNIRNNMSNFYSWWVQAWDAWTTYVMDLSAWWQKYVYQFWQQLFYWLEMIWQRLGQITNDIENGVDNTNVIFMPIVPVGVTPQEQLGTDVGRLKTKFPFSVPWDLLALLQMLETTGAAPVFDFTIPYMGTIHCDLAPFNDVAAVCRWSSLLAFGMGLMVNTKKLLNFVTVDVTRTWGD